MSDQSRLEMLRFLERYQLQQLEQTRGWIAAEERREAERQQREQPPVPDWAVELGIGDGRAPQSIHVGGCTMGGTQMRTKAISREQAVRALADGVQACTFCRPDTELGILD